MEADVRIENIALLKAYTTPGKCELCGEYFRRREGHHIFGRGAGRLDIPINLIAVGASRPYPFCNCHGQIKSSGRAKILSIVAKREKCDPSDIEQVIYLLRRLPKRPTEYNVLKELETLTDLERKLAERVLLESGHWPNP